MSSTFLEPPSVRRVSRVLILADESAEWRVAGLRQLERLILSLQEFATVEQPGELIQVSVFWKPDLEATHQVLRNDASTDELSVTNAAESRSGDYGDIDLFLSTRLFLYRDSVASLLSRLPEPRLTGFASWQQYATQFEADLPRSSRENRGAQWTYLSSKGEIARCERRFLAHSGKSQDGLVSRHVNRPLSRFVSRWLLKTPLHPTAWSALIFALPISATFFLCRGTYSGFVIGCAIFQLYSILDGCDGEIARAKFLQTEFGRRFDSICDLAGNMLLAIGLGFGLTRAAESAGWFYLMEGVAAALLTITSEGILFLRRSRVERTPRSQRWHGALYQRHHEFLERSGVLHIGENFAWWLVQLTKRDMAIFAFLLFALLGVPEINLHLLFVVGAISSALAGNAFLRQPAPVFSQEAS